VGGRASRALTDEAASPARRFLELLALSGLAVAQPVLDVIGKSPDLFVVRRAGWADVVLLVVIVVLGPAVVGWFVEQLAGLVGRRLRTIVHLLLLTTLAVLFSVQVVKEVTELRWKPTLLVGVLLGLAVVALVISVRAVRSWLRLLAVFPVVLGFVFLFSSPAKDVVFERGAANADVRATEPTPVVMIVLDELPLASLIDGEGHIERRLFPNFARLEADATWYRNHTTVAPATVAAVPAILTGRWPELGRASPTAANHPENLFTLLGDQYDLHVHETGTRLCPASLCPAPAYGALPDLLQDAQDIWTARARPKRKKEAIDLDVAGGPEADTAREADMKESTAELDRSGDAPRLDFVHAFLPHGGWTLLPSGARYVGPHPPTGNVFFSWVDDFAGAAGRARHLLQLQRTDTLLGAALDRLQELATYDDSLVVVTADHGVTFRARHNLRIATSETYPEVMWTPLFIKAPGQTEGELVETPARTIDILPTIADHLGIDIPWRVDGSSLLEPRQSTDEVRILASGLGSDVETEDDYLVFDGDAGYRDALALGGRVPPDPLGVYRVGTYGGLVGRGADDLGTTARSEATARLDDPDAYEDVDPDADELPVYVTGVVTAEHQIDVAVAVNGVVAGWCETAAYGVADRPGVEDHPFWMVIPQELLVRGDNDVDVYEVAGPPEAPRLRPVALG
jgi:hypothetical protein